MIPTIITTTTIPDFWFQAIRAAVETGREYEVAKGSTPTKRWELDMLFGQIAYPIVRPLEPDIPHHLGIPNPLEPGYAEKYLPYYMTNEKQPGEHYTYGQDLAWQIEWVIDYYRKNGPGIKHCCMRVGRPESLYNYDTSRDYCADHYLWDRPNGRNMKTYDHDNWWNVKEPGTSPCLCLVDTKIQDGKLHFSVHFRSWNLWSGMPSNLACLQMVKEYMAQEIDCGDGEIFVSCMKAGLAESVFEIAKLRTGIERKWEETE